MHQQAWKLRGDDLDWSVSSEVRGRIFYACGESWGVKEIGAKRPGGRGYAMDGERERERCCCQGTAITQGPLKTTAGLSK